MPFCLFRWSNSRRHGSSASGNSGAVGTMVCAQLGRTTSPQLAFIAECARLFDLVTQSGRSHHDDTAAVLRELAAKNTAK